MIRIGVIGAGFVGTAFVNLLEDESRHVALVDAGLARLDVVGVVVRDRSKAHPGIDSALVSDDVEALLDDDLDILVEVAGGVEPIRHYVESALRRGISVVTANKALMADCGTELARLAHDNRADLFYEAAVGGAIPILRALRTSLAGERIHRVIGIVNGTTNFILSKMSDEGSTYEDALAEAQSLGYAETDPSADVEAHDAAAKVQILSSLAFGTPLVGEAIAREGITSVRSIDVEFARRTGYVIKLLGIAERIGEHGVSRRAHPTLVPRTHPLAAVHGVMNAVFVEGDQSGPLMWLGPGAGGGPTATAVLGDVLDAARNRVAKRHDVPFTVDDRLYAVDEGSVSSIYYVSVDVLDRPGVLAAVASVFGRHGVSIQSMDQSGFGDEARLSFLTHHARNVDVRATLDELATLEAVDSIGACLHVLDGGN